MRAYFYDILPAVGKMVRITCCRSEKCSQADMRFVPLVSLPCSDAYLPTDLNPLTSKCQRQRCGMGNIQTALQMHGRSKHRAIRQTHTAAHGGNAASSRSLKVRARNSYRQACF